MYSLKITFLGLLCLNISSKIAAKRIIFNNLSVTYNKPIGNGIITAFNIKQAKERCGLVRSNKTNKGLEAAKAVMSILNNGPKKI